MKKNLFIFLFITLLSLASFAEAVFSGRVYIYENNTWVPTRANVVTHWADPMVNNHNPYSDWLDFHSNDNGEFRITRDPNPTGYPYEYQVRVEKSGYVTEYYDDVITDEESTNRTNFEVNGGNERYPNIDFYLIQSSIITGNVSSEGLPVSGIEVNCFTDDPGGWGNYKSTNTDQDGNYYFEVKREGDYYLRAGNGADNYIVQFYPNINDGFNSNTATSLAAGKLRSVYQGIDFDLTSVSKIKGNLVDHSTGSPIVDAEVVVFGAAGWSNWIATVTTDANGDYEVIVNSGNYKIRAEKGNYVRCLYGANAESPWEIGTWVSVGKAQTTENIDFQLEMGGGVKGTIMSDKGILMGGVKVEILEDDGTYITDVTTTADGTYLKMGIPIGSKRIRAVTDNYRTIYYNNASKLSLSDPINIAEDTNIENINFVLSQATTGFITGNVKDGATNQPLSNVKIDIFGSAGWVFWEGSVTTDINGNYEIELAAGSYKLRASTGNYVEQLYGAVDATRWDNGVTVNVEIEETTGNINFELTMGGGISGTIKDSSGNPVGGATIEVLTSDFYYYTGTVASADGTYMKTGIPTGDIWLRAVSDNYSQYYYPVKIKIIEDTITSNIDITLPAVGCVTGIITDQSGSPLKGIKLDVFRTDGGWDSFLISAFTDENGIYKIMLNTDTYKIQASSENYVTKLYDDVINVVPNVSGPAESAFGDTWDNGVTLNVTFGVTLNADFQMQKAAAVSGKIVDIYGAGLSNALVEFVSVTGSYVSKCETDSNGNYLLGGFPSGSIKIRAVSENYATSYWDGTKDINQAISICLTPNETVNNIIITLSISIEGTVTGTVKDVNGLPLRDVKIDAFAEGGWNYWTAGVTTDINGCYSLNIDAGSYKLRASKGYYVENLYGVPLGTNWEQGTTINIFSDVTTGSIDFILDIGGGVSGTILNENGDPVPNAIVKIVNTDGEYFSETKTTANGEYIKQGVPTGELKINATFGNYATWFYGDTIMVENATTINVLREQTLPNIDINFGAISKVTGNIKNEAGDPLAGVLVEGFGITGWSDWGGKATTNAEGFYELPLVPGDYKLRATAEGTNYIPQLYDANFASPWEIGITINVPLEAIVPDINFLLVMGGGISGKIIDKDDNPVPGVKVEIVTATGDYITETITGVDGSYLKQGIPTGNIKMRVDSDIYGIWYHGNTTEIGESPTLTVLEDQILQDIDVKFGAVSKITGKVVDAANGSPLAGTKIDIFGNGWGDFIMETYADQNGEYDAVLPAGTYKLRAGTANYVKRLYGAKKAAPWEIGETVEVFPATATEGKDFELVMGARVSGFVRDYYNDPMVGCKVEIITPTGNYIMEEKTLADGSYDIRGIPTGTIKVRTSTRSFTLIYDNAVDLSYSDNLLLLEDQHIDNINFKFIENSFDKDLVIMVSAPKDFSIENRDFKLGGYISYINVPSVSVFNISAGSIVAAEIHGNTWMVTPSVYLTTGDNKLLAYAEDISGNVSTSEVTVRWIQKSHIIVDSEIGTTVSIEAEAGSYPLDSSLQVSIIKAEDAPLQTGESPTGSSFVFILDISLHPSNSVLEADINIKIDIPESIPTAGIYMRYWDSDQNIWSDSGIKNSFVSGNILFATIEHLSYFAIFNENYPPNIDFDPIYEVDSGEAVTISAIVTNYDFVTLDVKLYYQLTDYIWSQQEMICISNNNYIAIINNDDLTSDIKVPYYIAARDNSSEARTPTYQFTVKNIYNLQTTSLLSQVINFPNPFGLGGTKFGYLLATDANVKINIFDSRGEKVKTLRASSGDSGGIQGYNRLFWDGRNSSGDRLANGVYFYIIQANNGSKKVVKKGKMAVLH